MGEGGDGFKRGIQKVRSKRLRETVDRKSSVKKGEGVGKREEEGKRERDV